MVGQMPTREFSKPTFRENRRPDDKTGGLDAEHRADRARTHRGYELLKARAFDQAGPRPAEVVVNHRDRREPDRACRLGERILPPLALGVLGDLTQGRLANVDDRAAAKMVRRDLRMHHAPPALWLSPCSACP